MGGDTLLLLYFTLIFIIFHGEGENDGCNDDGGYDNDIDYNIDNIDNDNDDNDYGDNDNRSR